ncbi:ATP-dependent nuclease [Cellulomonas sp. SG140]|uniref:ATP-dependent nuclease n=1 Tax=Cellulomonas sp. SG140 TaxID=2976536 RepID=UPI0021E83D8C|nr:ATP-dependent endonuclease [Cellulomonas sp. SG140]
MKIDSVSIKGFRCLADVSIDLDDYAAFIGANGAGKSSVLYALDWFFNNGRLSESDVHGHVDGEPLPDDARIEVSVTLTDLSLHDRELLGQYGRGERAEFRKTWHLRDGKTKVVGNARQGPGFAEVRAMSRVGEFRPAYEALRGLLTDLPDLGKQASKQEIEAALAEWERDADHRSDLVAVSDADANHMFGINGPNVIKDCLRFILIPAATNIASQIGESGRGSALTQLIGAVMADASARAQAEWLAENADTIAGLKSKVKASIESSTGIQAHRINARLASLVPNATVTLTPEVPDWTPKAEPTVTTTVTVDGVSNDVSRQGHGVQRAVMISMFQALVPDEELTRGLHAPIDGEEAVDGERRLANALEALPSIVVCIEEPEIYQHPVRARSFARTLTELSGQNNVQVIVATHSPYFVRPEQFASLRRFTLVDGVTSTAQATVASVAQQTALDPDKINTAVERMLPTEFSEGFFSDAVVLVEGPTDRVIIEATAALLGTNLDARGTSVLDAEGKTSLNVSNAILTALGVPTYIVLDGDALGARRKHPKDAAKRAQVDASHKQATEKAVAWLPTSKAVCGTLPFNYGDSTVVTDRFTIWNDDIEEELGAWESFSAQASACGAPVEARANKHQLAYKTAALAADPADLPLNLRSLVEVITRFSH